MRGASTRRMVQLLASLKLPGWGEAVPRQLLSDLDTAQELAADVVGSAPTVATIRLLAVGLSGTTDGLTALSGQLAASGWLASARPRNPVQVSVVQLRVGVPAQEALLRGAILDAHAGLVVVPYAVLARPGETTVERLAPLRRRLGPLLSAVGPELVALAVVGPEYHATVPAHRRDWIRQQARHSLGLPAGWPDQAIIEIDRDETDPAGDQRAGSMPPGPDQLYDRLIRPYAEQPVEQLRASVARRLEVARAELHRHASGVIRARAGDGLDGPTDLDPERVTDPAYALQRQTWLLARVLAPFLDTSP